MDIIKEWYFSRKIASTWSFVCFCLIWFGGEGECFSKTCQERDVSSKIWKTKGCCKMKYYHIFILIKNIFSVSSTVWKWGKDVALQCLDVSFLFFSIICVNIMATAQISKILTACLWFWSTSTKRPKMWSGVWEEEWLLSSKPCVHSSRAGRVHFWNMVTHFSPLPNGMAEIWDTLSSNQLITKYWLQLAG